MIPQPPAQSPLQAPFRAPDRQALFAKWLRRAKPRDTLIYYRGFLAIDRAQANFSRGLDETARAAYAAYEKGHLCLTQRRIKPDCAGAAGAFEYVATRTGAPL